MQSALAVVGLYLAVSVSTLLGADDVALWDAAKAGDLEAVKAALDAGTAVDAKTKYRATALAFAAERGHLDVVQLLIDRGADVNNKDTFYGFTPRTWAQFGGHSEVVKLLDEHGGQLSFGNAVSQQESAEQETQTDKDMAAEASDAQPKDAEPDGDDLEAEAKKGSTVEFRRYTDEEVIAEDLAYSSANWPQFRGLAARGIADGQNPPLNWNGTEEASENVVWKTSIPGLGNSSPVIWGDYLYVTSAVSSSEDHSIKIGYYGSVESVDDDSEHEFVVLCLNKRSGEIVWSRTAIRTVPLVKRHLKSTHADPTVATDGKRVIAFFGAEGLYCYDTDGELLWQKNLGALDSGWFYDPEYQWEFGSSPIIFGDWVILQCDVQSDSFIAAFDLQTGVEVWRTERDEIPGWATPTVHETPSGPLLFTNGTRAMRCYYADTGKIAWTFSENSEITAPTPFVAYGAAYLMAGYRPIQPIRAITLSARGDLTLPDGETTSQFVRWSTRKGGPYLPTAIAYRGHLYVCGNQGVLACYDAHSGERRYRERLETPGQRSFVGSSVAADGHLYFPAEDGHVIVVAAGPEFKLISTNPVGESVLSSPAISENMIYFRTPEHVITFSDSLLSE